VLQDALPRLARDPEACGTERLRRLVQGLLEQAVGLRVPRGERGNLERTTEQVPEPVVTVKTDEDDRGGGGILHGLAEPVEVRRQAARAEADRAVQGGIEGQRHGPSVRRRAHRALAFVSPGVADDERAVRAEDPAMQGVRDGNEIRRAAERDRHPARDRADHSVDRVIDLHRPRLGRAKQASAEGAQLAVADREPFRPFREPGERDLGRPKCASLAQGDGVIVKQDARRAGPHLRRGRIARPGHVGIMSVALRPPPCRRAARRSVPAG
jgi:hypothetical protein